MKQQHILYLVVLAASIIFLVVGNRVVSGWADAGGDDVAPFEMQILPARVVEVISVEEAEEGTFGGTTITFLARISRGESRGEIVSATQSVYDMVLEDNRHVSLGDRVLLFYNEFGGDYYFTNFERLQYVLILAAIFAVLMILFGGIKGINSLVSLALILCSIFFIFIPSLLNGGNPYVTVIVISLYAIVATMLVVVGINKKAFAAICGCVGGVVMAGLLMRIMDHVMVLSGFLDSEHMFLASFLDVDLRAIVFAGVTIGVLGAVMDVALSISSSLWELNTASESMNFAKIYKAGVNIGRDIVGTMLNTLVLAYMGSSLAMIMLISMDSVSMISLFNLEMVLVEILRALIGSFGLLLAIPLTAVVCAWVYSRKLF